MFSPKISQNIDWEKNQSQSSTFWHIPEKQGFYFFSWGSWVSLFSMQIQESMSMSIAGLMVSNFEYFSSSSSFRSVLFFSDFQCNQYLQLLLICSNSDKKNCSDWIQKLSEKWSMLTTFSQGDSRHYWYFCRNTWKFVSMATNHLNSRRDLLYLGSYSSTDVIFLDTKLTNSVSPNLAVI